MSVGAILLTGSGALALGLGWTIGANDAANALGAAFGAGVLSVRRGVLIASVGEFAGAATLGSSVAATLATKVLVDSTIRMNETALLELPSTDTFALGANLQGNDRWAAANSAALAGAALFLATATKARMPASSTHSAVAALVGGGLAASTLGEGIFAFPELSVTWKAVQWEQIERIVASWVVSPLLGGLIALVSHLFILVAAQADAVSMHGSSDQASIGKWLGPLAVFLVVFVSVGLFMALLHKRWPMLVSWTAIIGSSTFVAGLAGGVHSLYFRRCPDRVARSNHRLHRWSLGLPPDEEQESMSRGLREVRMSSKGESLEQVVGKESPEPDHSQNTVADEGGPSAFAAEEGTLHDIDLDDPPDVDLGVQLPRLSDAEAVLVGPIVWLAFMMCVAHGSNDVANALGPFVAVLWSYNGEDIHQGEGGPWWSAALIGAGITGGVVVQGHRVMKTVGSKIARLNVRSSFSCQLSTVFTVLLASGLGLPVSTTHVLIGALCGVAAADSLAGRLSWFTDVATTSASQDDAGQGGLRSGGGMTLLRIAACWVLTLPAAAAFAAVAFSLIAPLLASIVAV